MAGGLGRNPQIYLGAQLSEVDRAATMHTWETPPGNEGQRMRMHVLTAQCENIVENT